MDSKKLFDKIEKMMQERDEALLSLDEAKIVAFCMRYGLDVVLSNELLFWASVHKARLRISTFSEEARLESERWLKEHGFKC
jgi:hypothetical protein